MKLFYLKERPNNVLSHIKVRFLHISKNNSLLRDHLQSKIATSCKTIDKISLSRNNPPSGPSMDNGHGKSACAHNALHRELTTG